jgi:hypothetical protein
MMPSNMMWFVVAFITVLVVVAKVLMHRPRKQSDKLTEFYKVYLVWLQSGAPEYEGTFRRGTGLCYAIEQYCLSDYELANRLLEEMKDQFKRAGLHVNFPFNNGNSELYFKETTAFCVHRNMKRYTWVKEHANG